MFDWNDLRYFIAVAREGSTIAAAGALKVNQSTVQRRLAALEEKLGRKLVERTPTGYRLTELGQKALVHAQGVEDAVAAFERTLASSDTELAGTIRVTCSEADIYRLLTPVLARFGEKYPGLRVDFLITEALLDLARGEADIALRGGRLRDDALIGRKIADCPWVVYASRAYIARRGRPECVQDLAHHAVIGFKGQLAESSTVRWLLAHATSATMVAHSDSLLGALSAVKSGVGLAILPAYLGNVEDDIVQVLDAPPDLAQPLTMLVHPDLRHTPRVRAFFDFIVAEIDTLRPLLSGRTRYR